MFKCLFVSVCLDCSRPSLSKLNHSLPRQTKPSLANLATKSDLCARHIAIAEHPVGCRYSIAPTVNPWRSGPQGERSVSLRLRQEIQAVLRRGGGELSAVWLLSLLGISYASKCDRLGVRGCGHEEQAGLQGLRYRGTVMRATR